MRKIHLILWALLVPFAQCQVAGAADDNENVLQGQKAAFDTSVSLPSGGNGLPSKSDGGQTSSGKGLGQGAVRAATVEPSVCCRPPQVALASSLNAQERLIKVLNGWSSVATVEFVAPLSTGTARVGDLVEAKLEQDFRFGPQLIAGKDSLVRGHVTEVESARTLTSSALSSRRRLKSRGRLSLQFDEIIDESGYRWPILATPSPRQKNDATIDRSSARFVEADADGRIVKAEAGLAGGLKATSNAAKVVSMVPLPGTLVFSALAPAVAMGVVGAASPSVAYDKPVEASTEHRRAKGAAYAFLSNLPGAVVVKAVVEKGNEIELAPGDRLTLNVCIKDTGYRLPPGEQQTVNGRVMNLRAIKRLYPASYSERSR